MVAIVSGNGMGLLTGSSSTLGQLGVLGNPNLGNSKEGAYVNIATGNLVLHNQDEFIAAAGVNLSLTRTYNSQGGYNNGYGPSWRMGAIRQIVDLTGTVNTAGSTVTRINSDGSRELYRYDAARAQYLSTDGGGGYNHLSLNASQEWVWTADRADMAGLYENYGPLAAGGRIQSSGDQMGARIGYQYDGSGLLSQVTDASGDVTRFDYVNGNLSQIRVTDRAGVTSTRVHYSYDTLNRLIQVSTDLTPDDNSIADGKLYATTYTYLDNTNEVASVTQSDGTRLAFGYKQVGGAWKIDTVTDGLGQVTRYAYGSQQTTVTDPLGNNTVYTYDAAGQLLTVTEPATLLNGAVVPGQVTTFAYDANGNVLSVTDGRGKQTTYEYDANGNRTRETNAAGDFIIRNYNPVSGLLISETQSVSKAAPGSPFGVQQTTRYLYDNGNRLQFIVAPGGAVTEYRYDANGQRTSALEYAEARMPDNGIFLTWGLLDWTQSASTAGTRINRTDFSYDARGLVSKTNSYVVDNANAAAVALPAVMPANIANASKGSLTFTSVNQPSASFPVVNGTDTLPLGSAFHFKVTTPATLTDGLLAIGVSTAPAGDQRLRVLFDAGVLHLQARNGATAADLPLGSLKANTSYTVDIITEASGEARITVHDNNSTADALRVQRFNFTPGSVLRFGAETSCGPQYGGATSGASNTITVSALSARAPATLAVAAASASYVYDQHGQLLQTIDGKTQTSAALAYDGMGRLLSTTSAATGAGADTTLYSYDEGGGSRSVTLSNGLVTKTTYDRAGHATSVSQLDKDGRLLSIATNSYDNDGQLRRTSAPNGAAMYFLYDEAGRQTAKVDANGDLTAYFYNADGQVSRTIQYARPLTAAQMNQLAQVNGNWPRVSLADLHVADNDADNRSSWNLYDDAGRLSKSVDASGLLTVYVYDQAGRVTQQIRRAYDIGKLANVYAPATLDDAPTADDQVSRNVYGTDGKLQLEIDPAGYVTEHRYDALGQPVETLNYAIPLTAAYLNQVPAPAASAIIGSAGVVASHQRYFYNTKGQLAGTLDNGNYLTELKYDANGNLLSRRHYAVAVTAPSGARMSDLGYAAGPGDLVTSYTYTARNQLETETAPGGIVTRYTYDKLGKLIETRVGTGATRAQAERYDLQGRLIGELNAEGVAALASAKPEDVDGIWLRYGSRYTYNENGLRLTATDQLGNQSRYYYDGQGNLSYTINAAGEVTALAYNAFNQLKSKTSYGTRIDAATLATLGGGQNDANIGTIAGRLAVGALDSVTRYEYDHNGRQSAVVDALGNRSTVHYDAFGRVDATEQQNVPNGNVSAPSANAGGRNFYDVDGRLQASLTSGGVLTVYTYNAIDQLTDRITYAKPVSFTVADLNAAMALVAPDAAHDSHQHYFYDARGLLAAEMRAEGLAADGKLQWSVIRQDYDGNGNLTMRTAYATPLALAGSAPDLAYPADSASDSVTVYAYDGANRLAATATAQNTPDPRTPALRNWSVVRNTYDALGNLSATTAYATPLTGAAPAGDALQKYAPADAGNATTYYTYDSANRVKTVAVAQNSSGGQVQWAVSGRSYDAAGNLSTTTQYATAQTTGSALAYPTGAPLADPGSDRTTTYRYDANNRLQVTIDANGAVSRIDYDGRGNVAQRTQYAAPQAPENVSAAYHPAPQAADRVSRTVYDLDNRPLFDVDAAGNVVKHNYDGQGNLASVVRYATAVNAALVTDRADSVTGQLRASADDRSTTYAYDQNHRLRFTLDARGYVTENRYDNFGRLSDTLVYPTVAALADTSYANLVNNTAKFGTPRVSHFDYDAQGNLVKSTDAMTYSESFGYDALGRKTSFTNKLQQTWTYAYDDAGHLVLETAPPVDVYANGQLDVNPDWTARTPATVQLQTFMQYDMLGNLTSRTEGYGSSQPRVTGYAYDLVGRQIKTTLASVQVYNAGETASAIGAAGRNEVPSGELTIEVRYDMLGNAVANKDVGGNLSYKVYDRLGQLRYDVDAAGYVTGYVRDSFGAVTTLTRYNEPMPGYAAFKADAANRTPAAVLASLQQRAAAVAAADRSIATRYDQLGQVVKVSEPLAWVFDQHALGGASMMLSARTTDTSYDAFGAARQVTVYGADAAGAALTSAASTRYFYDANGNKTAQIAALQDDAAGRLGYLTTYTYDQAGDLLTQTEYATAYSDWHADWKDSYYGLPQASDSDRLTVNYYNANRRKVLVAREHQIAASYTYDKLGNTITASDGGGNTTFSYYDALGRVSATAVMHYPLPWVETPPGTSLPAAPTPLTEFRRDLYGNVVTRIDYANGAPAGTTDAVNPFSPAAAVKPVRDPAHDRVTSTTYDSAGRAIQVYDAEGKAINTSYDKFGRVAKQWRTVTNLDNADHQVETLFTVTRYDVLGHVASIEKPGNIDLIHGRLNQHNTIQTNTYNAFGEVTQAQTAGANQNSEDDWETPFTRTDYTRYDNAGHAWLSNAGDGVDKLTLFDAQGNVSSSIVCVNPEVDYRNATLRSATDVRAALQTSWLQRTDYSYDLMGRQVDARASSDAQLYVMVRDPVAGNWYKLPQVGGSRLLDSLLVVADTRDQGTPFKMSYRLKGGAWIDAAPRLQSLGGATVFSTQGLAAGDYEYQVVAQPAGEAEFVRTHGAMQIANQASADKNVTLARIYALLLNRAPDLGGLNFYVARANEGASMAAIVLGFLASTEAAPNLAGTSEAVIKRIFAYAFGRDGANDPSYAADVAKWSVAYDRAKAAGGNAPGQLFLDLIDSVVLPVDDYLPPATKAPLYRAQAWLNNRVEASLNYVMDYRGVDPASAATVFNEAATNLAKAKQDAQDLGTQELRKTQVAQMYLTLFGRAPDAGGVVFWLNALKSITPEQMATGMLDSPEAKDPLLYPDNDLDEAGYNRQLVAHAYQNMLGRAPSAAEAADWTARFAAMGGSARDKRGQFVMQLVNQVANYGGGDPALQAQKLAFNNKVAIALNFGQVALGNISLADQGYVSRAVFAAVTSAETAKAAAEKAETTLAASATAMAAVAAAARAAAGAAPLEDMRAQVTRLYVALLNRTPDTGGLAFQLDALQRMGGGQAAWNALANGLITSAESQADTTLTAYTLVNGVKTATTDAQFVQRIYQLALGRLPTSGAARQEMLAFQQQLTASNRGEIAVKILNGMLSYPDLSADDAALKATFNNKVGVALACVVNLSAFDWANAGNIGAARSTLDKVTATDLHAALAYAYGLAQAAGAQPTIDAATQAKASVATASAAAAANALARNDLNAASALAAAQPSAAQRLQVMQMYTGILGRTPAQYASQPDVGGLEFQIDALNRTTMDVIAGSFITSAEGLKIYPAGMSDADFVAKVYATVLGSAAPGQPDSAAWVAKLGGAAPMSRGQVALAILDAVKNYANYTPDANARSFLAARQAFLQRVADNFALVDSAQQAAVAAANAALVDQNKLGATLPGLLSQQQRDAAAQATAASDATAALSGANSAGNASANRRLQLTLLYATLLQRKTTPTQGEFDFYVTGNGAAADLPALAQSFIVSKEAQDRALFPADNRAFIATLYNYILGRSADASEIDYWLPTLNAVNGRGQVAVFMLNSYNAYSDSKLPQLQRKAGFDQTIAGFLAQQNTDAAGVAAGALALLRQRQGETASAAQNLSNARALVTSTKATVDRIAADANKDYAAADMLRAAPAAYQSGITYLYLGIRGSVDFGGLAWQMSHADGSAAYRTALIGALLTEANNGYPAEPVAYVQKLFLKVLGRVASATDSGVLFYANYLKSHPDQRTAVAEMILNSDEAAKHLNPLVATQVAADIGHAQSLVDGRAAANTAYANAQNQLPGVQAAYDAAAGRESAAGGVYTAAANAAAAVLALKNAYAKTIAADNAYISAAQSRDAYGAAKSRYDAQQIVLAPQIAIVQGAATATPADHAGAVLAAKLAAAATADLGVAGAYIADAATSAVARSSRQVSQLYVALMNRAPQFAELRFWNGKLAEGMTLANVAKGIMESSAGAALYPASLSNDGFVTQLYKFGLARDFSQDPGGLRFWSDKLGGAAPLSRAELAAAWAQSVPANNNSDSVTFDNKVAAALQALIAEGKAILATPGSLAPAIQLAEETARGTATTFDAAARALAASTPMAQYVQPVTRLYLALFNRVPDTPGVPFWIKAYAGPPVLNMGQVAQAMLASPEAAQRYPAGTSDSAFLTQVFTNAMGRAPGAAELNPYLAQVAGQGRGAAAANMINAIADGAATGDLDLTATRDEFNAKVGAAMASVAGALTDQARYLDQAVRLAHDLAASNPLNRHVDGVVMGVAAAIVGGEKSATINAVTLDRWGNVLNRVDARDPNWSVTYTYNHDNQVLTQTQYAKAGDRPKYAQSYSYDVMGRVRSVTEGADPAVPGSGHTNRSYYDANGNLVKEVHADGGVIDYQLDVFGQRTAVWQYTDAGNAVKTDYSYDRLGRQTSRTTAEVTVAHWNVDSTILAWQRGRITDTYAYDELGRRIRSTNSHNADVTDPNNGLSTLTRYDLGGNIISVENGVPANRAAGAARKATLSVYDAFNGKFGELSYGGTIDEQAQPGGAHNYREWVLDERGRAIASYDLSGARTDYNYDAAGKLTYQGNFVDLRLPYQNLRYTYDNGTGRLLQIDDRGLHQLTTYTYDRDGNRLSEQVWLTSPQGNRMLQDNRLSYDHQGRLTDIVANVAYADYKVHYEYDDYGNRKSVDTTFTNDVTDKKHIWVNYEYDSMNRQTRVSGGTETEYATPHSSGGGRRRAAIVDDGSGEQDWSNLDNSVIEAHTITYDWLGNRSTDNNDIYRYDEAGRLSQVLTNNAVTGQRWYDSSGQVISSTDKDGIHYNSYDTVGHLIDQRNTDINGKLTSKLHYQYDEAGNLYHYGIVGADSHQVQMIDMVYGVKRDGYLLTSTTISNLGDHGAVDGKTSVRHYDVNGHLSEVTGVDARTVFSDSNGHILEKTQGGVVTHSLVANDQLIGSSSRAFESFSSVYDSVSSPSVAAPPSVYVVQSADETLRSIAKMVWGDERLWYLIGDVNGINAADSKLTVGQPLKIPTRVNTVLNGYQSFKPYDASAALGSTTPELAMPQAPQSGGGGGGGGGCGGMGKLIMVVIAVAVTIYTAGAMSGVTGGFLNTMAAGASALGGGGVVAGTTIGAAGFTGGAIAGAVGSIASQAVGNLIGAQDGFSWTGVALSALGAGVSSGVAEFGQAAGSGSVFNGSGWQAAAARATLSNVVTQGAGMITGLQSGFDWRGVAASAAGSLAGSMAGDAARSVFGAGLAANTVGNLAANVTASVMRGGRIDLRQIATDAFGNALGSSFAAQLGSSSDAEVQAGSHGDKFAFNNSLPTNIYAQMRADAMDSGSVYDFVSNDQLQELSRLADANGGVLPKGILDPEDAAAPAANPAAVTPATEPAAEADAIQRVIIVGQRPTAEQRAEYENQAKDEIRLSMLKATGAFAKAGKKVPRAPVSKSLYPTSAPLSDAEFKDSTSLTRSRVREIIESHNPLLVKVGAPDLLYDAAQKYQLNPKILLASMAQEQSWGLNGKLSKLFGIDAGGGGNPAALSIEASIDKAAQTYRRYFDEATADPRKLNMKIDYDPRDKEQIAVVGRNGLASWQHDHADDVTQLHQGFQYTARTSSEYARLKYTPFTYFAPQNSRPYDAWINLVNGFKP